MAGFEQGPAVVSASEALLRVEEVTKTYPVRRGVFGSSARRLTAVNNVSLTVGRGEILGLVGESGSGKTTCGRLIARLEAPDTGRIGFDGQDWLALRGRALRRGRRHVQVIFQDPQTSLNPRMTAGDQVAEPLRVQGLASRREIGLLVEELLAEVGLSGDAASRYPSEFSGGQRQRISIARALATRPKFLVCDEPVSSLDVSVAAQVINLLLDLREKNGLSYLFISHDLATVERISDRIAVMYLGRIVEEGPSGDLTARPLHPYTTALLSAVPDPDPASTRARVILAGDPPSPAAPPSGCAFHPRCPIARPRCREEAPPLLPHLPGRLAACFYPGELSAV